MILRLVAYLIYRVKGSEMNSKFLVSRKFAALPACIAVSLSLLAVNCLTCTSFAQGGEAAATESKPAKDTKAPPTPAEVLASHTTEAKQIIDEAMGSMKTFSSAEFGVSMDYPSNFTYKPSAEPGLFGVASMGGIVNVSWSTQKLDATVGETLDKYAESNKTSVAALDIPGYKFSKFISDTPTKSNGLDQRRILVEAETPSPGGAVKLRQLMIITIADGTGYVMCGTAPDAYYSFVEPLFNKMGASFKKEKASAKTGKQTETATPTPVETK